MSIIKEIYDVAKDGAIQGNKINAIKRALKTELKLNQKFLADIEKSKPISNTRRIDIIAMLDISELGAAVKYEIPYTLICNKKVDDKLSKSYNIKRLHGFDFEMLVESLYLKIAYLKKDFNNTTIDLNLRLINIYKYNSILIQLLR
jgi:hypothetical protein